MANMKMLAYRSEVEGATDNAIIDWFNQVASLKPTDVRVPSSLGTLPHVEAVCDRHELPFYIIETNTRAVSVALKYTDLYEYEMRR